MMVMSGQLANTELLDVEVLIVLDRRFLKRLVLFDEGTSGNTVSPSSSESASS